MASAGGSQQDNQPVYHRPPTEEDVQSWMGGLGQDEVKEYLTSLTLKKDGPFFALKSRMYNWLQGNYTAADFEPADIFMTDDEIRAQREALRKSFIEDMCYEKSATTIQDASYEKGMAHPLSIYQQTTVTCDDTDEGIPNGANAEQPKESAPQDSAPCDPQGDTDDRTERVTREDQQQGSVEAVLRSLQEMARTADIRYADEQARRKKLEETNESLQTQIRQLQEQLRQLVQSGTPGQQMPMSSTRIDGGRNRDGGDGRDPLHNQNPQQGRTRVNFQDTFDLRYPENSGMREDLFIPPQSSPHEAGNAWRGRHQESGTQPSATQLNQSGRGHEDPSRIVSRWNVKFTASPGESVETFLRRFEENARASKLTESDMLASLPCVLTDMASMWYSNQRRGWTTWQDFCHAICRRWSDVYDKQERLRADIRQRYQQEGEPSRLYVTCMESMLREIQPPFSEEEEVDKIYMNLLPPIKRIVHRDRCHTIDDLVAECNSAEYTLAREKSDRAPLSPSAAVMPEAFKPVLARAAKSATQPKVAAVTLPPKEDDMDKPITMRNMQDIAAMIAAEFRKGLQEAPLPKSGGKGQKGGQKGGQNSQTNGQPRADQKGQQSGRGKDQAQNSGPGKNQNRGPIKCYGCQKEGVRKADCPNCSPGNEQTGGQKK